MKKYMMMAALAAATVGLFTSCSEEEIVKVSAQTGEPIRFAATARVAETRTVYGEKDGNQWPLYWVNNDEVKVYSPQAQAIEGKTNTATYTVSEVADNKNIYEITGEGLYWGAEDTHNFYEAYPAKNVEGFEDGVLTATMPANQVAKYDEKNGCYVDMDAALMAGKTSCNRSSFPEEGVNLPFAPIFTAIDITVKAADDRNFILNTISVKSVSKETGKKVPLAGSFTYNIESGEYVATSDNDLVQLELPGNGVTIEKKQSVNVTIFVLGNYDGTVKVQLNGQFYETNKEESTFVILVKDGDPNKTSVEDTGTDNVGHTLKAGARNRINLGTLPTKPQQMPSGDPLGSNWMAFEKNATPVSMMSIPGSFDSGNVIEGTAGTVRTQTNSINDEIIAKYGDKRDVPGWEVLFYQLNHGVRAFDLRMRWDDTYGFFVNNRGDGSGDGYKDGGATNPQATKLREFLPYVTKWLSEHKTEFVVIFLQASPELGTGTSARRYPAPNNALSNTFDSKIKSEITTILAGQEAYYLDEYNPDITVNEARGKILFVTVSNNATMDYVGMRIPRWSSNTNSVQTCGSFSIFDYVENDGTAIRNSRHNHMKAANDNSDKSKWFLTGLNPLANKYDSSNPINGSATTYIKSLNKCGIVLGSYVCVRNGAALVDAVWQLNFK